jgi:hypothetical protein
MMSTEDNVYGTWAGEPANEDNLTPEQEFDMLFGYAEERHRGYTYMDEVAPYGSENIEEEDINKYDYADGYER